MTNRIPDFIMEKKIQIEALAHKYRAKNLRIFGSQIHGQATYESDVDVLAEFNKDADLFDLMGLTEDLTTLLGKKIDVGTPTSLHWSIRDSTAYQGTN
jgi:uncharacterized protein